MAVVVSACRKGTAWQQVLALMQQVEHVDVVFRAAHMASCVDGGDLASALVRSPNFFVEILLKKMDIGQSVCQTYGWSPIFRSAIVRSASGSFFWGIKAAYRELPLRGTAIRRQHVLDLHDLQPEEAVFFHRMGLVNSSIGWAFKNGFIFSHNGSLFEPCVLKNMFLNTYFSLNNLLAIF